MILGIAGSYASGKDTIANYLEKKGFVHFSLSDVLREQLKEKNIEITRKNLQNLGNSLREKLGSGALAEKTIMKIRLDKHHVISSIGTLGEIKVLKTLKNFKLIFVDAAAKIRFERMKERNREKDPKTLNEFNLMETLENKGSGNFRTHYQTKKVSNIILNNNSTITSLYQKIEKVLKNLNYYKRPNWEEYFISIANIVGTRSTCDRGKTGAIIVKNKRILSTGYAGAPSGLSHCDEEGHQIETTKHLDGMTKDHCVRTTHAEQNAIVQAAKHGTSIDNSTIYVKMEPCPACAKMIINSGIKRVVCAKRYHAAQESRTLLKKAKIIMDVLEDNTESY